MRKPNTNYIEQHNRCYGDNNSASKFAGLGRHIVLVIVTLLSILAYSAFGQGEVDGTPVSDKMAFFNFMEGEWEGQAEVREQDGSVTMVQQHEHVQIKLDGSLVLIEGTGRDADGQVAFNAVATIYYDALKDEIKMMAFRDNGQNTLADVSIVDDAHFIWSFSPNAYAHIKYVLQIDSLGKWTETGFFSPDKTNWNEFFSMELTKIEK